MTTTAATAAFAPARSLHAPPALGVVVREQIRAVGRAIRVERNFFLGLLGAFVLLTLYMTIREAGNPNMHNNMTFGPAGTIPMTLVALFVPFSVWRDDDRARRSYFWAMPISDGTHTLIKVLAGWVWLVLATILYLIVLVVLGVAMRAISGGATQFEPAPAWVWLIPFTSVTIAYLLVSIPVVGAQHRQRWIGGVIAIYLALLFVGSVLRLEELMRTTTAITTGQYGLWSAVFGDVDRIVMRPLRETGRLMVVPHGMPGNPGDMLVPIHMGPDASRWLVATLLWGSIVVIGIVLAARRRPDA